MFVSTSQAFSVVMVVIGEVGLIFICPRKFAVHVKISNLNTIVVKLMSQKNSAVPKKSTEINATADVSVFNS